MNPETRGMDEIRIDKERCVGCGQCVLICPAGALSVAWGLAEADPETCVLCLECLDYCPLGALEAARA
ncbi:MAG: 4Fe-4S binding protein [Proteobacteria bacterium]|nr:4Fe-4S binding protein [Pseudomonadota bacterium]